MWHVELNCACAHFESWNSEIVHRQYRPGDCLTIRDQAFEIALVHLFQDAFVHTDVFVKLEEVFQVLRFVAQPLV